MFKLGPAVIAILLLPLAANALPTPITNDLTGAGIDGNGVAAFNDGVAVLLPRGPPAPGAPSLSRKKSHADLRVAAGLPPLRRMKSLPLTNTPTPPPASPGSISNTPPPRPGAPVNAPGTPPPPPRRANSWSPRMVGGTVHPDDQLPRHSSPPPHPARNKTPDSNSDKNMRDERLDAKGKQPASTSSQFGLKNPNKEKKNNP